MPVHNLEVLWLFRGFFLTSFVPKSDSGENSSKIHATFSKVKVKPLKATGEFSTGQTAFLRRLNGKINPNPKIATRNVNKDKANKEQLQKSKASQESIPITDGKKEAKNTPKADIITNYSANISKEKIVTQNSRSINRGATEADEINKTKTNLDFNTTTPTGKIKKIVSAIFNS